MPQEIKSKAKRNNLIGIKMKTSKQHRLIKLIMPIIQQANYDATMIQFQISELGKIKWFIFLV